MSTKMNTREHEKMKYYKEEGFWASSEELADICRQSIQEEFRKRRATRRAAKENGTTPNYGHFTISDKD